MPNKKRAVRESLASPTLPTIPASAFKATCLELMDELAARHTEIVVTKHGRPVVKVGPVVSVSPSPVGFLRNTIIRHGDIVSPDHEAWSESSSDPLEARKR